MDTALKDWRGRTVIVTGAAGGLGRLYALGFARHGAHVICADMDQAGLDETAQLIRQADGSAEINAFDMADEAALAEFAACTASNHPRLGLLLNNAAIAYGRILDRTETASLDQQTWLRYLAINSVAPTLLAIALRGPLAAGGGCVINQSSMAGSDPTNAYGVTKATLNAMTRMLAQLLGPDGIRVNAIAPGLIVDEARAGGLAEKHVDLVTAGQMLARQGNARDLMSLALYLASDEAAFMTSEVIHCDGGSNRRSWRH